MSYRLKHLIDKLIIRSLFIYNEEHTKVKTPGKLIKNLPKDERELLKGAKSKDFYHRIRFDE